MYVIGGCNACIAPLRPAEQPFRSLSKKWGCEKAVKEGSGDSLHAYDLHTLRVT
jgi:hypothetical protein